MDEIKEECGVAAVYLKKNFDNAPNVLYDMLCQLQHRGQLSCGISVYNPLNEGNEKILKVMKNIGKVSEVFCVNNKEKYDEIMNFYKGSAGIGHVRYATSGSPKDYLSQLDEAQPFFRRHGRLWKRFSIAFNGNLTNYESLKGKMQDEGYILDTNVDTELIMHLLSLALKDNEHEKDKPDIFNVVENVIKKLDGSFNVVMMFADGDLAAFRDSFGLRPLVYGENEEFFAVASESVALERIGIHNFFPVEPGSCILYNKNGLTVKNLVQTRKAHCQFERVYFSRADSIVDCKSINSTRESLGKKLAELEPLKQLIQENKEDYIIVPVPNSAIPAAEAFSLEIGLPLSMAITRNESERGFINKELDRKRIIEKKYGIISEKVNGKKVILIEDSIVRGETSKKIITILRNAGAREVHIRSTEPKIKFPCFYGVDFPTYDELISHKYKDDLEIAREIGADSVFFMNIPGLIEATGFSQNELCLACLNGDYPTEFGKELAKKGQV